MDSDTFWEGALKPFGYKGALKMRTGGKKDGCAIFYKNDKYVQHKRTLRKYKYNNEIKI